MDWGANFRAEIFGLGHGVIQVCVNINVSKCIIKNFKIEPTISYQILSVTSLVNLELRIYFDDKALA